MPNHIYKRPHYQVTKIYQGKELETLLQSAMQQTFDSCGITITQGHVQRFLGLLPESVLGGTPVLILEQWPLNSMTAHGKYEDLIYAYVRKTGNQYSKTYRKPYNPRTPSQQAQRDKITQAVTAWLALSDAEKESYRQQSVNKPYSGYNWFIANYLKTH